MLYNQNCHVQFVAYGENYPSVPRNNSIYRTQTGTNEEKRLVRRSKLLDVQQGNN